MLSFFRIATIVVSFFSVSTFGVDHDLNGIYYGKPALVGDSFFATCGRMAIEIRIKGKEIFVSQRDYRCSDWYRRLAVEGTVYWEGELHGSVWEKDSRVGEISKGYLLVQTGPPKRIELEIKQKGTGKYQVTELVPCWSGICQISGDFVRASFGPARGIPAK